MPSVLDEAAMSLQTWIILLITASAAWLLGKDLLAQWREAHDNRKCHSCRKACPHNAYEQRSGTMGSALK
jgi:hypothetical protein